MDRDKIARLLAELAKVGDIEKCRTHHFYVWHLFDRLEDLRPGSLDFRSLTAGISSL